MSVGSTLVGLLDDVIYDAAAKTTKVEYSNISQQSVLDNPDLSIDFI